MKFRIRVGTHIQNDPVTGPDGKTQMVETVYRSEMLGGPDIIESSIDLCERYNVHDRVRQPDGSIGLRQNDRFMPKFERVHEHFQQPSHQAFPGQTLQGHPQAAQAAVKAVPAFDGMNQKQLLDWAAAEEVDLKGATKREDVLRILKAAVGR